VPYGTALTPIYATFTTTGTGVTVDSLPQQSGITQNDFSFPVPYKVTGADGTWATYTVIVTVSANTAKAIQTFTLGTAASGVLSIGTVIDEVATPKTIAVTMPFGTTDLTALVATFTTTGSSVKIGSVTQNSGAAPTNNFTNSVTTPLVYTVTAANGTTATYNVSVTVALNSANAITAFSLAAVSGVPASTATAITGTGTSLDPFEILVTMPNGTTDLTKLVATFSAPGASSVKVGSTVQQSTISQNDFSAASGVSAVPVQYVVTAADASTATYNVTVAVAVVTGPPIVDLKSILTNNFVILATTAITEAGPVNGAITGNIGLSPGTGSGIAVTCAEMQGSSKIHASDAAYGGGTAPCAVNTSSVVGQAVLDLGTAYTAASDPATPHGVGANLNLLGGILPAGTNFAPGTYTWGTDVNINGDITLTGSASDVWIFQISGNLVVAAAGSVPAGTHVILGGSAQASNVFWQVGGASATLGTYSTFNGNILTSPSTLIAIQTGAILHGRALAGTSVALDGNIVGP
jgi:hypothetical protein